MFRPLSSVPVMLLALSIFCASTTVAAELPLPPGMGGEKKKDDSPPPLPPGLEEGSGDDPGLPPGMGGDDNGGGDGPASGSGKDSLDLSGFLEGRFGLRTQEDDQKDAALGEVRLQLQGEGQLGEINLKLTVDFLVDPVYDDYDVELEEGTGLLDIREASASGSPLEFIDLKVGRQILTWGTGDMVFINDLFPKDWNSFFIGRDVEYLKAPSDAAKVSLFSSLVNLDAVYVPRFDADRFIDGSRISYFNPGVGQLVGNDNVLKYEKPDDWFSDDEVHLRLYKNLGGYEVAAYYYNGFWKSPGGMNPLNGQAIFPELQVYGASLRGNLLKGIVSLECGYYDSSDDSDGDNPLVNNSQIRCLVGYSQDVARNFTVGLQWYLERTLDHDHYIDSLPPGALVVDQDRHLVSLRLTRMLMKQNLMLSLFSYWSPTDKDAYLRPKMHYKIDDAWSVDLGANIFLGEDQHTFFGQFERNNNVFAGVRYSF
jgi:hypothetical protein